jgi:hypothetical protein
MLSQRPSVWAAPSTWKLEVETPHKNFLAAGTRVFTEKATLLVVVMCLPWRVQILAPLKCGSSLTGA